MRQETRLVADRLLEVLAGVDAEVPYGVALDLAARGPAGGSPRLAGRSDLVVVTDADEQRTPHPRGGAHGSVEGEAQKDPGGYLVAPVRVGRQQGAVARLGVGACHGGDRSRRTLEGHQHRRPTEPGAGLVAKGEESEASG